MEKKRIETSKLLLLVSYALGIILTTIVIVGTFLNYEVSNITTLAALAWGEIAVSNAFYFRKSAKENVPKILKNFDKETLDMIDVNQLLNE